MYKIIVNTYESPVGKLLIGSYQDRICLCDWKYRKRRYQIDYRIKNGLRAEYKAGRSDTIDKLEKQLHEYFQKKREEFDIPIIMVGTDFQKLIWQTLLLIRYGTTETYAGLASMIKNEKAVRAAASANGANAISIIIPCHRIISSNGTPGGYAGGVMVKQKLLDLEQQPELLKKMDFNNSGCPGTLSWVSIPTLYYS